MVIAARLRVVIAVALLLPAVQSFTPQLLSVSSRKSTKISVSSFTALSTSMTDDDDNALLDQILAVAMDASQQAGQIIIGNAGGAEVTERKANSRDLLTLIDPLCEKVGLVLIQ